MRLILALLVLSSAGCSYQATIAVSDKGHLEEGFFGNNGYWLTADKTSGSFTESTEQTPEPIEFWWEPQLFGGTPEIYERLKPGHVYEVTVSNGDGYVFVSEISRELGTLEELFPQ